MISVLLGSRSASPREQLLALSADRRPTPGRLTGEVGYRPWLAREVDASKSGNVDDTLVAAAKQSQPDTALLHFLNDKTDRAIAILELAARNPADAPAALTDLSAVYLARFEARGDPLDLLRAVHSAERSLSLQPSSGAGFNRAMALSLLGTRNLATKAWRALESEGDGWKEEASAHLRALERRNVDDEWANVLRRIEARGASASEVRALVQRFPANARAFGEEVVLPRWAAAIAAGDAAQAEQSLLLASRIGEELARSREENLLDHSVTAIRRTMREGSAAERNALIRGLQDFGAGVAHFKEQRLTSAHPPFTRAAKDLAAARNPLHLWARFYVGVGEYFADATRGLAMLDGLVKEIVDDRYPALVGRAEWMAGTADKVQGRVQSSVHRYEHAASTLRRSGGDSAAAFVCVLLAESYTLLGEHSRAWENRKRAFREVPYSEGPRRNVAMWTEAKEGLFRQGNLRFAGPFVDEAVILAESDRKPLARASAYLDRAAFRLEIRNRGGALADLHKAQEAIAEMERGPLRDQMAYLALLTEGLCAKETEPARAAELLRRGLEGQGSTGTKFEAITYTTALANAEAAAGDIQAAARSLESALEIFEQIRATVEDPVSRMQAFRQAQPAFDRLIELRTTSLSGDLEEPFRLAERSRGRVLLELAAAKNSGAGDIDFVRLTDLEKELPPGVALVSYVVLEDRILAWVIEDGLSRRCVLKVARGDVEDAIERFRLELTRNAEIAALRRAGSPLYDFLIRPLALSRRGKALIVVPDRRLARLPFAALFDRESERYLIEQRTVSVTPSATFLVRSSRTAPRSESTAQSALVMAVSSSGSYGGTILPSLPHSAREASAVAALYPNVAFLRGPQATRRKFLDLSLSTDVVHFAGHALVDLDAPRRSVLLFADATGEALEPLSLGELFDAGAGNANLVVLSACRAQDSLADDREGLLGLAGAFIAAGAREVVASPLDVNDHAAPAVMAAFHRQYRTHRSAAVAFREAVLELLRTGEREGSSPAAWGGFTVIEGSLDGGER
ncbi:MAG TPA: CHAT domain-containing protein [Thermoanaerobaculia bacterium]|nr:CHAT domain-containing protein [Thermoanaerobaculia bacterium]